MFQLRAVRQCRDFWQGNQVTNPNESFIILRWFRIYIYPGGVSSPLFHMTFDQKASISVRESSSGHRSNGYVFGCADRFLFLSFFLSIFSIVENTLVIYFFLSFYKSSVRTTLGRTNLSYFSFFVWQCSRFWRDIFK